MMKMNIGLTAWNQVDGIAQPKTCQSAFLSAKICSVLPCCSYTPQNTMLSAQSTTRPMIAFHSRAVSGSLFVFASALAWSACPGPGTSGPRGKR